MKTRKSPPREGSTEEISALIETLHQAEKRLEELTVGEVDTVTNRDGRTIMLRHAQEQLRHSEAAKQAAILNALPANIALLDSRGIIISVNETWQQFGRANAPQGPGYGIGVNYLEVCDSAHGEDASEAQQAAAGIRSVLAGEVKHFSMEYPCHSLTEQRWFLMTVTPLADNPPKGAVVMHLNITERRRVEEALRDSEVRYRAMFDQAAVGITQVALDGTFLKTNPAFCSMLGYSESELTGKNFQELTHPDDLTIGEASREALLSPDVRYSRSDFEKRYIRKDGSTMWVRVAVAMVHNEEEQPIYFVTMVEDISQRKQAEIDLLWRNAFFEALVTTSADGIIVVDAKGRIILQNRRTIDLWKIPEEVAADTDDSRQVQFVTNQTVDAKQFVDKVRYLYAHPEETSQDEVVLKDGTILDRYSAPVLNSDGHSYGRIWSFRDITERKQREEQILRLAERLTTTLESITDAFFTVDQDWRFTFLNREAERLLGRTRAELTDKDIWTEFPGAIGSTFEREYRRAMADNKAVDFEEFYPPLNTWFGVRAYPSEQGLAVYFRDVTETKRTAEEIKFKSTILQTQQDISPDAILVVDAHGKIISYNQQFIELWRLPPQLVSAHVDAPVLQSVVEQVENSEAFAARVQYLYEHHDERSRSEIRLKDGRVVDRYSAPLNGVDGRYYGRVWYFRDITESKQAELELRESERRFSDMLGNMELVSMMLDREARITYCNEHLLRLTGWRREEIIGQNWFEFMVPPELNDLKEGFFAALLANLPDTWHHDNDIITRSGERRLIRWNNTVLRSGAGDVIGTASIGEDITERKAAESKVAYLNRVYAMLSGINTLIVRVRDRDDLFSDACRIAVTEGGFRMAMIGIVDRSTMRIIPVATAGKDEELVIAIKNILSSGELASNTMVARAIRGKIPIISNDSQSDPQVLFGKKYAELGVHSMVILPLIVSDEAVGALALYASEREFFKDEELKLLTDMAGDIAFGIDHLDKQERLDYLAYYDALTGLANRSLFLDRVSQYMKSATRGGHKLALFLIDLERFKNINDSLGRSAGDALLIQVTEWLKLDAGDANLVARVSADHFSIVLPQATQVGDVVRILEKTMEAFLSNPFHLNDAVFRIAAKVGVALFPDDGADAETLFRNAEAALKMAKASGERYLFYTQKMTATVSSKLTLETQLRQALDKGEFALYYQPKMNTVSGNITSAEALIRWNDPRTGLVPPDQFIPILEETGLINDVGRWALHKAAEDYLHWLSTGLAAVRIAVNVSPLQLRSRGFIDEIKQVIARDARVAAGLELEITESLIMADVKHSIITLQAIRAMGISIAIDDFGTGFSSLSYLAKLPVDTLKIDRSFVIDMTAGPDGLSLVATIINLAHSLKLNVVAEGVETEEQARLLRLLGCDEMQGYIFSKPVPSEIFETRFLSPPPGE